MSKAILVMDMPDSCRTCDLRVIGSVNFCTGADCRKIDQMKIINEDIKPDWCPLRELPEKSCTGKSDYYQWGDWEDGWNACIDDLLGE